MFSEIALFLVPALFVLLLFLLRKQDIVLNLYVSMCGSLLLGLGLFGFILGLIYGFDNTEKHGIVFGDGSHSHHQEQPLTMRARQPPRLFLRDAPRLQNPRCYPLLVEAM